MAKYNIEDGTRITLDSKTLNMLLNETKDVRQMKEELCFEICRQELHGFSKKDNTRVFLEIGIETVPSEMTARILLRLVENYCNHFDKFIAFHYHNDGTKTLEFR